MYFYSLDNFLQVRKKGICLFLVPQNSEQASHIFVLFL